MCVFTLYYALSLSCHLRGPTGSELKVWEIIKLQCENFYDCWLISGQSFQRGRQDVFVTWEKWIHDLNWIGFNCPIFWDSQSFTMLEMHIYRWKHILNILNWNSSGEEYVSFLLCNLGVKLLSRRSFIWLIHFAIKKCLLDEQAPQLRRIETERMPLFSKLVQHIVLSWKLTDED